MICFNRLGSKGRLGNQMFQYAATLGIARKIGTRAVCNIGHDLCSIGKCFKLGSVDDAVVLFDGLMTYREPMFSFNEDVFHFDPNLCIDLDGYFQTEKYFKHIREEILDNFTFLEEIQEKGNEIFYSLSIEPNKTCSIHVRRGDYLILPTYHPSFGLEYYSKALNVLDPNEDLDVLVFSDDPKWCMDNFGNKRGKSCIRYAHSDPFVDLYMMSKCCSHVIANSSFSWWGSWLSGKPTVAPKTWFGPNGNQDWQDIYAEGWVKV